MAILRDVVNGSGQYAASTQVEPAPPGLTSLVGELSDLVSENRALSDEMHQALGLNDPSAKAAGSGGTERIPCIAAVISGAASSLRSANYSLRDCLNHIRS